MRHQHLWTWIVAPVAGALLLAGSGCGTLDGAEDCLACEAPGGSGGGDDEVPPPPTWCEAACAHTYDGCGLALVRNDAVVAAEACVATCEAEGWSSARAGCLVKMECTEEALWGCFGFRGPPAPACLDTCGRIHGSCGDVDPAVTYACAVACTERWTSDERLCAGQRSCTDVDGCFPRGGGVGIRSGR